MPPHFPVRSSHPHPLSSLLSHLLHSHTLHSNPRLISASLRALAILCDAIALERRTCDRKADHLDRAYQGVVDSKVVDIAAGLEGVAGRQETLPTTPQAHPALGTTPNSGSSTITDTLHAGRLTGAHSSNIPGNSGTLTGTHQDTAGQLALGTLKTLFESFTTLEVDSPLLDTFSRSATPAFPFPPALDLDAAVHVDDHPASLHDLSTFELPLAEGFLDDYQGDFFSNPALTDFSFDEDVDVRVFPDDHTAMDATPSAFSTGKGKDPEHVEVQGGLDPALVDILAQLDPASLDALLCSTGQAPAPSAPAPGPAQLQHQPQGAPSDLDPAAEYALLSQMAVEMGFDKEAASVALGWLGLAAPCAVKVEGETGEAAVWAPQDAHTAVDDGAHDDSAPRSPTEFDPNAPPSPTHSDASVFAPSPSPSPPPPARRGRGRPRTRPTPTPPPSSPGGGPLRLSRAHIKPPSPTTGRTHVCGTCGWAFKRAHNLANHAKTHEVGGKWACGVEGCSKTFTRPYDLERHARVHTGAKPYQCDACGALFARQDRYRAHVRSGCASAEE